MYELSMRGQEYLSLLQGIGIDERTADFYRGAIHAIKDTMNIDFDSVSGE